MRVETKTMMVLGGRRKYIYENHIYHNKFSVGYHIVKVVVCSSRVCINGALFMEGAVCNSGNVSLIYPIIS